MLTLVMSLLPALGYADNEHNDGSLTPAAATGQVQHRHGDTGICDGHLSPGCAAYSLIHNDLLKSLDGEMFLLPSDESSAFKPAYVALLKAPPRFLGQ